MTLLTTLIYNFHKVISAFTTPLTNQSPAPAPSLVDHPIGNVNIRKYLKVRSLA